MWIRDKHFESISDKSWEVYTHPEGNLYFRKKAIQISGTSITLSLVTEDYLLSQIRNTEAKETHENAVKARSEALKICDKIENDLVRKIKENFEKLSAEISGEMELEAYIGASAQVNGQPSYYLVNHETRSIFWLENVNFNKWPLSSGVPIQSDAHLSKFCRLPLCIAVADVILRKDNRILLLDAYETFSISGDRRQEGYNRSSEYCPYVWLLR